jgi:protein gp37
MDAWVAKGHNKGLGNADDYPDWIVCGGESGNERRPMQQEWAEELREEALYAGVAFYMKQMSARTPEQGKELIPSRLLIREFPKG